MSGAATAGSRSTPRPPAERRTGPATAPRSSPPATRHVRPDVEGQHQAVRGEEAAVFNGSIDAGEVLVDDAPRAQVHVPDFGIAHLPVRQAHMTAFGMDQRMRRGGQQSVPVGQLGLGQRIVFGLVSMPPAIQDQQDDGLRA